MTRIISNWSLVFFALFCSLLFVGCSKNSGSLSHVKTPQNIINGSKANPESLSSLHTVAIGYKAANSKNEYSIEPFCTGIAISKNLILTAAHCIQDDVEYKTLNNVLVFLGTNTDTVNQDNLRSVSLVKLHPEFNVEFNEIKKAVSTFNDIALIKIKGTLPSTHKPANLLDTNLFLKKNSELLVAGWGLLQSRPDISAQQLYETTVHVFGYWRTHILHDDSARKTGFCNGDSGGPGYLKVDDQLILVGLVRGPHYPNPNCQGFGEFTNAGFHKNFILKASQELEAEQPSFLQIPNKYLEEEGL